MPTSDIQSYLSSNGILNNFKMLSEKINFNTGEGGHNSCSESSDEMGTFVNNFKPSRKKRKT